MSKRAEDAALKAYPVVIEEHTERDVNKPRRLSCIKGYEQAEKDLIPLINRLCEAILFDWKDKDQAELAWKIQSQIKEETK